MTNQSLKVRISQDPILLTPGVYDALTANLAQIAGFEAVYLSGAAVAYTRLGKPDIGLTTSSEMADTLALIADQVTIPIIIDADAGFGNALNAQRTMRQYERAGASALQIEDQSHPKRCGHLQNKSLVSTSEMVGKIKAMIDVRQYEETLIIARTDAIAVEGFENALDRAHHYHEAGADVLFIEAPQTTQQLADIVAALAHKTPLLANMVEGGSTPMNSANELEQLGFSIAIFPGGIVRAIAKTAENYYRSLLQNGSNQPFMQNMFDFNGLNQRLGTERILQKSKEYE